MDSGYKKITDINFGEYDATNYRDSSSRDLFNRIFYRDNRLDQILENNKYFVLGDKGTGKTAYSVYLSNNIVDDTYASIVYMGETEYGKFVRLKEQRDLILSDYTDVWRVILLLLMSDKIYKTEDRSIFNGKSFSKLKEAIDDFYYCAFKPEIKSAIEFVEQAKDSATMVFEHLRGEMGDSKEIKFSDTRFQSNLMFLEKQFISALEGIKVSKKHIIFIDGIDVRPDNINYNEYLECIKGLAQAVWVLNTSTFQSKKSLKKLKIMLLIRPDIFDQMGLHNMNNKLNDNCVLLEWRTTYQHYRTSGLFEVVDKLFRSQQDDPELRNAKVGEAWDHYFPFKVFNHKEHALSDSSFIPFLRYSFYRPRDILAYLSIMKKYCKSDQSVFSWEDFNHSQVQKEYSHYLLGEIRDNLAFYHPASDFDLFRNFFQYLKPYVDVKRREFKYNDFVSAYDKFITHIDKQGSSKPLIFQSADYVLQLLFELNIIAYIEEYRDDVPYQRWYFKERSHANIRPKVKINAIYRMHKGIAQALYVVM
jgi:GTPase SAR1 family protein